MPHTATAAETATNSRSERFGTPTACTGWGWGWGSVRTGGCRQVVTASPDANTAQEDSRPTSSVPEDVGNWLGPLGLVSVAAESVVVVTAGPAMLSHRPTTPSTPR